MKKVIFVALFFIMSKTSFAQNENYSPINTVGIQDNIPNSVERLNQLIQESEISFFKNNYLNGKSGTFFVHGTNVNNIGGYKISESDKYRWKSIKQIQPILNITGDNSSNSRFEWMENGAFNKFEDRLKAAKDLGAYLYSVITNYGNSIPPKSADFSISLVGHSHGGNVCILAAAGVKAFLIKNGYNHIKVNVITICTPVDNGEGSYENPDTWGNLIDNHIHLYNNQDLVQTSGASALGDKSFFDREYSNKKTVNVKIDVSEYYGNDPKSQINAHSFDIDHPELIQKNIDNGKIPTLK